MEFNVKNKKELIVNGHSIFIFSSFYVNPQSVLDKALKISPFIHKEDPLTLNTLKFLDLRHKTNMPELDPLINYFEDLTKQKCTHKHHNFKTNIQKWFKGPFNNYKENYWWPHYDEGHALLIYLNKNSILNLYENTEYFKIQQRVHEHIKPWHPKKHYHLIKELKMPFNSAILFPANMILHGCGLNDDYYFSNFRIIQAVFFKK